MTSEKCTVIHGVFPNKTELKSFLGTFKEQPISHYQADDMVVEPKGRKRYITLYIKEYASSLVKSAFRDGVLSRWKERFKPNGPHLV